MSDTVGAGCPEYHREWTRAEAAKEAGRLEEAHLLYAASGEAARLRGHDELVDRAFCNQAAVGLELGNGSDPVPRLREILVRRRSLFNCLLAARHIARAHELRREYKKGIFYARLAHGFAVSLGKREWEAIALNEIGNCMLGDSLFEDAARSYREAVALVASGDRNRELTFLSNLGYCEIMLDRHDVGLRILYGCLRAGRRQGLRRVEMVARIDLSFALLQVGKAHDAERHARRGLALAEASGESDWIKNALYLLGEAAVMAGGGARGQASFAELQRRFYPSQPYLADFLVSVDVRSMINLHA